MLLSLTSCIFRQESAVVKTYCKHCNLNLGSGKVISSWKKNYQIDLARSVETYFLPEHGKTFTAGTAGDSIIVITVCASGIKVA